MCALAAAELGCGPEDVLVCSTGLIGYPLPMDAARGPGSRPWPPPGAAPAQGIAAAEAIMTTDTRRKEAVVRGDGFVVGGMAKGAAMLAPTWPRCWRCSPPTPRRSRHPHRVLRAGRGRQLQRHDRRRLHVHQRHRAAPGQRPGRRPGPGGFAAAVADACLDLATQMVGDAEGHTKVVRVRVTGRGVRRRGPPGRPQGGREPAGQVLVVRRGPVLGPGGQRPRHRGGQARPRTPLTIAYGGTVVSRGCVGVAHDAAAVAAHMAGEYLDLHCDLGVGDGRAQVLTNDLTYGYIDENKGTS